MHNTRIHATALALAITAAVTLGGCATLPGQSFGQYPQSPLAYSAPQAQTVQQVRLGTVLAVRAVTIKTSNGQAMAGSGLGILAGGLLGHQIGSGKGKALATIAGAVGGAVAGNALTAHAYSQPGLAITVRIDTRWGQGQVEQVTQAVAPGVAIAPGMRVEIVGQGCYGYSTSCPSPARVIPLPAGVGNATQRDGR